MRLIRRFWSWFGSLFRSRPQQWQAVYVEDVPKDAKPNSIYLVGEGSHIWFSVFLCPCGCGDLVQLSLLPDDSPRWQVASNADGSVTLSPSVWRTKGCKSHFFVRRGLIVWC
jgi:hypothetical protein